MKIAQVVAAGEGSEPTSRDIERVVGYLMAQLVADGHEARSPAVDRPQWLFKTQLSAEMRPEEK